MAITRANNCNRGCHWGQFNWGHLQFRSRVRPLRQKRVALRSIVHCIPDPELRWVPVPETRSELLWANKFQVVHLPDSHSLSPGDLVSRVDLRGSEHNLEPGLRFQQHPRPLYRFNRSDDSRNQTSQLRKPRCLPRNPWLPFHGLRYKGVPDRQLNWKCHASDTGRVLCLLWRALLFDVSQKRETDPYLHACALNEFPHFLHQLIHREMDEPIAGNFFVQSNKWLFRLFKPTLEFLASLPLLCFRLVFWVRWVHDLASFLLPGGYL